MYKNIPSFRPYFQSPWWFLDLFFVRRLGRQFCRNFGFSCFSAAAVTIFHLFFYLPFDFFDNFNRFFLGFFDFFLRFLHSFFCCHSQFFTGFFARLRRQQNSGNRTDRRANGSAYGYIFQGFFLFSSFTLFLDLLKNF